MNLMKMFQDTETATTFRHKAAKLVIGGIAGLTAKTLAEKVYDLAIEGYRASKIAATQ